MTFKGGVLIKRLPSWGRIFDIRRRPPRPEQPVFSLCHSTARLPGGWIRAFETWFDRADHPDQVEYILTVDEGTVPAEFQNVDNLAVTHTLFSRPWHSVKLDINRGRRCAVDGWNSAAKASTGKFLITVADDFFPPKHWDTEILKLLPFGTQPGYVNLQKGRPLWMEGPWVLDVDDKNGEDTDLLFFSFLTRPYYESLGGRIFHPEYFGMFGDNDFTEEAKRDGVIVNARHLKFTHEHPAYGTAANDATYQHQHRGEAWERGKEVFKRRWPGKLRDNLIVCLPGERFSGAAAAYWTRLYSHLLRKFNVGPMFKYSTNIFETRAAMAHDIVNTGMNSPADFVLMLDDDNLLSPSQFDTLFDDLAENPQLSGVAGWYWVTIDNYDLPDTKTSVGSIEVSTEGMLEQARIERWEYDRLARGSNPLLSIEFSGLGCVLFRQKAFTKLDRPFRPYLSDAYPHGFAGDDGSFFIRAKYAGLKFAVDRRIKIPHLKMRSPEAPGFTHKFPVIL
jgi:hypothetical protein